VSIVLRCLPSVVERIPRNEVLTNQLIRVGYGPNGIDVCTGHANGGHVVRPPIGVN
jgi:hypothetical protein